MKIKITDIVYGVPLFAGLTLQIFAIDLFRLTFISTTISAGTYLLSGITGFFLIQQKIRGTFKNKLIDLIVSLTYCIVSIGGILIFLFLSANYYFANTATTKQRFPIVKTGTIGKGLFSKCTQPFAEIEKGGLSKEIIFKCNLFKDITSYKSIDLLTSKGALGFDIIRNKQLIE
jgi:hypothetical protein